MARAAKRPDVLIVCPVCLIEFDVRQSRLDRTSRDICCSRNCEILARTRPLADRFWEKVRRTNGCWLWMGSTNSNGYGQITRGPRPHLAHRIAWELTHGSIPDGLCVLHDCPDGDNPRCVNPEHLFLGTQCDNIEDMVRKGRHAAPERLPQTKLTAPIVREIRRRYASGVVTQIQLSIEFGVCNAIICEIISRKRWKHVS